MTATTSSQTGDQTGAACWLFDVSGMDCGECARTIEAGVRRLPGVAGASVNFGSATLTVIPASSSISPGSVVAAVSRAGFRALPRGTARKPDLAWWRERRVIEIVLAAALWAAGFVLDRTGFSTWITAVPYLTSMSLAGYPVARAAWFAARARRADMNVLMTIAAAGALPLGEWEEGSSVLLLFSIGLLLQVRTVDRTRRAIQELARLAPDEATIRQNGIELRLPVAAVQAGELVVVRPGERLPLDGTVVAGSSEIDQSAITGESMPVDVAVDSSVFAGTMNGSGLIDVRVTKTADESTLSGIVRMVEQAQASRAPSQAFVDRFAEIYTPVVVLGAIALAITGSVITGDIHGWAFRGLVMLVVACPCALVISTPVALVSAIGSAARYGVLFKGAAAIESLATVTTVAFDKTGTLTHGRPAVTRVISTSSLTTDEILAFASAVEHGANHPIARGIVREAADRGIQTPVATNASSQPGRGATATIGNQVVMVATPRAFSTLPVVAEGAIAEMEAAGETAVVVERDAEIAGVIGLVDPPRTSAAAVIRELGRKSIQTVMLSGDSERVARRIGERVGAGEIRAQLLPADKVNAVTELSARGPVAMIGDGVNDAPALATAAVGIAMGVAGSEVALEAADVALMGDDLTQIPAAIDLAHRTMRIIRQNIALAILVKAVFIGLTVAGITNLWLAVAADTGMSLLVTANALRLLRYTNSNRR